MSLHDDTDTDAIRRQLAEATTKLVEAINYDVNLFWGNDPRDYGIGDSPPGFVLPGGQGSPFLNRNRRGDYNPAFLNEEQLSFIRRRVRAMVVNNEIALNVLNVHKLYAVGKGLKYEVEARNDSGADYVESVQALVDAFGESNELSVKESEIIDRVLIDGECFIRLFPTTSGLMCMRFVEPEYVKAPSTANVQDTYGVRTALNDVETVEGYWVVEGDLASGNPPAFVPASEIVHFKHWDTPSSSKRGLSAFYPVESSLRGTEDLLLSTISMAKARAKVAMVRKIAGAVKAGADALVASQRAATMTDQTTGNVVNMERIPYGGVLTTRVGDEIEFPSAGISAADHVGVMQMALRYIASRFSMPEYMLSSDASNSNYASTLVAESPFVRFMEFVQDRMATLLGKNRWPGHRRSLVWRQIQHAIDCRFLPVDTLVKVNVTVTGPTLTVRDTAKEAQVDKIYIDAGVKSIKTVQLEQGLDPDAEEANMAAERASRPKPVQMLPPAFGQRQPTDPNTVPMGQGV